MKCELVRDDLECVSPTPDEEQTVIEEIMRNGKKVKRRFWKRGSIIDDPKAFRLVQMGVAVPADEECKNAAGMSAVEIELAKRAAERLQKGIIPKDYDLFDRGVILGYNPDGSYKPGPNWHEMEEEEADTDDLSDEE